MREQAQIIQFKKQEAPFVCSACGADRGCDCSAPAIERAAKALAKTPEKSDRAIAKETGLSHATVSRARSTVSGETVEKRIGLDGKARRVPDPTEKTVETTDLGDPPEKIKENLLFFIKRNEAGAKAMRRIMRKISRDLKDDPAARQELKIAFQRLISELQSLADRL